MWHSELKRRRQQDYLALSNQTKDMTKTLISGGVVLAIVVIAGLLWGVPNYSRYQARQDAENQVAINAIIIQQQEQNIQVEKQKAQIRVVDAQGIAQAQQIIAASLTDSYLQYLAIDAQKAMATGSNHTEIYIPSGANGIPLVKTIGQ